MDISPNNSSDPILQAGQIKERDLMRRADHASDIGTFMSLASSALYFIERAIMGDRLPKGVSLISIGGVTVGMGSVIYAIKVRHNAGKIARENDERVRSWTQKQEDRSDDSQMTR